MSNVLQVFYRQGAHLVFAGLELFCLYLIVNFNSPQQEVWLETKTLYTSSLMTRWDKLMEFSSLREQNEVLQSKYARLLALQPNASYDVAAALDSDSLANTGQQQRYSYIDAQIVNKSPLSNDITYVINRGYIHGVEKHQGVISEQGVVGIVLTVSARHARVMSILHHKSRISAGLIKNNFFGSLHWEGGDTRYMTLSSIPEYASVKKLDTIATTGYSSIFPPNVPIGVVDTFLFKPGESNYTIKVRLFNDFFSLNRVYVARDLLKDDIEELDNAD